MRKNTLIVTMLIAALGSGVALAGGGKGGNSGSGGMNGSGQSMNAGGSMGGQSSAAASNAFRPGSGVNRSGEQATGWTVDKAPKSTDSVVLQNRDRERDREQEQLRLEQHDSAKSMAGTQEPVKTRTQERKQLQDGSVSQP